MYNRANSDIYSMNTERTEWGWNGFLNSIDRSYLVDWSWYKTFEKGLCGWTLMNMFKVKVFIAEVNRYLWNFVYMFGCNLRTNWYMILIGLHICGLGNRESGNLIKADSP